MKLFGSNNGGRYAHEGDAAPRQERQLPEESLQEQAALAREQEAPASGISEDLYRRTHDSKGRRRKSKKLKLKQRLTALAILLAVLVAGYCLFVFAPIPGIRYLRDMYISTALRTGSHKWLATAFIPKPIWQGIEKQWNDIFIDNWGIDSTDPPSLPSESEPVETESIETDPTEETEDLTLLRARRDFYELFHELDIEQTEAYFAQYPQYLENGYANVKINEAGLNQDGLDLYTADGEQVLAIDAANGVLILREKGSTFRGVLAICKDPAQLHLFPSSGLGSYGEHIDTIASRNNGLVAMTGSGFIDEGGNGNGGTLAGFCMCDGQSYGRHYGWGYWRIELRENNWLYIRSDTYAACPDDCTDAVEFQPALIVNGYDMGSGGYYELNPRACLGQSSTGEILMIVTEGRLWDSPGCSVSECTRILLQHDCITAMNMDGGTSAILWYDGEPITRCSNQRTPAGRYLPNAWVYVKSN